MLGLDGGGPYWVGGSGGPYEDDGLLPGLKEGPKEGGPLEPKSFAGGPYESAGIGAPYESLNEDVAGALSTDPPNGGLKSPES